MNDSKFFFSFLLNPNFVYASITLAYFTPPFISGLFFSEVPLLFLSPEASELHILYKGFFVVLISIMFFILGGAITKKNKKIKKSYVFVNSLSLLKFCILLILLGISIYDPVKYFSKGYLNDPFAFNDLKDARLIIGNGIIYFCGEIFLGISLIIEINSERGIRLKSFLYTLIILLLLGYKLKRLELIIPLISALAFYATVKQVQWYKVIFPIIFMMLIVSLLGEFRQSDSIDGLAKLALILEANYTCNSFFATIYLIDDLKYSYTYGFDFLLIPIEIIPSFILPMKHELIQFVSSDDTWSKGHILNPMGAFFGLAKVYKQGGTIYVACFSFVLGNIFQIFFQKFKKCYLEQMKTYYLFMYPITLYSFFFHFVRDDIMIATKISIQVIVLYYIIVIAKSMSVKKIIPR